MKKCIYILIPVGKAGNISSLSLVFLPWPSTKIPKSEFKQINYYLKKKWKNNLIILQLNYLMYSEWTVNEINPFKKRKKKF